MIVAENSKPTIQEFTSLMRRTDSLLNNEASSNESYFQRRNGTALEKDVYDALSECAKNTPFENSIELVSGSSFPDIVAAKFYGVEVKSTEKDKWQSIGSSILESTRIADVERIFLTFGKLGRPVKFLSRPYEHCLSDIVVTHYPRYRIDMNLAEGESIFDKMGVSYDALRKMDSPVPTVTEYYKSNLKLGQSLWWVQDSEKAVNAPTISLWSSTSVREKTEYMAMGFSFFPEIVGSASDKYNRFSLWLVKDMSIVNNNIRDSFSAGGKAEYRTQEGIVIRIPASLDRIRKNASLIREIISQEDESNLERFWDTKIQKDRVSQWIGLILNYLAPTESSVRQHYSEILNKAFFPYKLQKDYASFAAETHPDYK